jgi:CheY-like chemotaxis protein
MLHRCGPRKLAKTLALCLERWADIQVEQAFVSSPTSPSATQSFHRTHFPIRTHSTPASTLLGEIPLGLSPQPVVGYHPEQELTIQPRGTASIAPFLIVDDNDVNLKILSAYLSRKSLPFCTASDGLLAVAAYKESRGQFSAVFMDIQMPRMDGISATRAIREYESQEELQAVTVVALTGVVTEEKQKEAEASGFNEFFAKPVRLKALDGILERTARLVG